MRGATILHMVLHLEVLAAATQLMLLCHYRAALLVHYFHLMVLVELLGIVEVTLLMLDGTRMSGRLRSFHALVVWVRHGVRLGSTGAMYAELLVDVLRVGG